MMTKLRILLHSEPMGQTMMIIQRYSHVRNCLVPKQLVTWSLAVCCLGAHDRQCCFAVLTGQHFRQLYRCVSAVYPYHSKQQILLFVQQALGMALIWG